MVFSKTMKTGESESTYQRVDGFPICDGCVHYWGYLKCTLYLIGTSKRQSCNKYIPKSNNAFYREMRK